MNPDDEEHRIRNRLHIILVIQALTKSGTLTFYDEKSRRVVHRDDKTGFLKLGFVTFGELFKTTHQSKGVLAGHLMFLESKGYLFSKNGVYRINPAFEDDFRKINSQVVAWLGAQALAKSRHAFNRFLRYGLREEGYGRYRAEIEQFAREEKRLRGIEL